jgi:hypothetical protein
MCSGWTHCGSGCCLCVCTKSEYWSTNLWIISADLWTTTESHSVHNELTKWSEACRSILRWVLEVLFLTSVNVSSSSVNNVSDLWIWNDRVTVTSHPYPCFHSVTRKCRFTVCTNPMKMNWRIEFFDLVQRRIDRWWNLFGAELLQIGGGGEAERFRGWCDPDVCFSSMKREDNSLPTSTRRIEGDM